MRAGRWVFLRFLLLSSLFVLHAVLSAEPASARTWRIQADRTGEAPTVQAGIDSAAVGDTVLVGPGTYRERINFLGKDIVVVSEAGPEATVLDGENRAGAVVVMRSGEGRGAVIEGFTIRRGTGEPWGTARWGAGVYIVDSSPVVRGNVIARNSASQFGGGIFAATTTGVGTAGVWIEGNLVRDNRAGVNGGGIALLTRGEVRENLIEDNECETGDGGGLWIYTYEASPFLVESNRILRNRAGDHGGGIYSALGTAGGTIEVSDNVIAHNWAGGLNGVTAPGGGIYLGRGIHTVRGNTIVFNEAQFGASVESGGAMAVVNPGTHVIEQNIIAHTLFGGGIHCAVGVSPEIRDNLAWSNVGGDGVGTCDGWERVDGNLVGDPLLCDPGAGDFTVARLSPALTHPTGPLGAYPEPGCEQVPVQATSWGRIKRLFGTDAP